MKSVSASLKTRRLSKVREIKYTYWRTGWQQNPYITGIKVVPVINKFIPNILHYYHSSLILIRSSKFTSTDTQMCGKLLKMKDKAVLILKIHKSEIDLFTTLQNLSCFQEPIYIFNYLSLKRLFQIVQIFNCLFQIILVYYQQYNLGIMNKIFN